MAGKPIIIDHTTCSIKAGFAGESEPSVQIQAPEDASNWAGIEEAWRKIFADLKVNPEDRKVLLTEAPFIDASSREQKTQIMFEKLKTPAFFLAKQPVLAMFAAGQKTAIGIDIGETVTRVVPVVEGFMVPHAVKTINFGAKELQKSFEPLFEPSLLGKTDPGLPTLICDAIVACDAAAHSDLYQSIVLCGEAAPYPGMSDRVQLGTAAVAPPKTVVKVMAPNTRHQSWIGGSILASIEPFADKWITKKDYDEAGPKIVATKC